MILFYHDLKYKLYRCLLYRDVFYTDMLIYVEIFVQKCLLSGYVCCTEMFVTERRFFTKDMASFSQSDKSS